ncbi:MAG: MFS family permease [Halieaceae bacterium]|jgi:MFS family permease
MRALITLTSLLLSTFLLLVGHGMQLTLLPLRATAIGHSDMQIALAGSSSFAGFLVGCFVVPQLIARVGHIRSFSVLASAMTSALLLTSLSNSLLLWIVLRFLVGICICGLYTVIESWLNDQADESNRGTVLSVYTFLVLAGVAVGQQLINTAPVTSATPFILVAALVSLSIIPVSMTRKLAPAPIESTRASFSRLYRRSRVAFAGALLSGAVSGSFWSLGAIFAQRSGLSVSESTVFMSVAVLGGAILQYPFGWLSDRIGRHRVMALLAALGAGACAAVALASGAEQLLIAIFLFGATTMPIYAMALAAAADNSQRHEFVEIGTSVLMLNAAGAVGAPLLFGQAMLLAGPLSLFWGCAGLCLLTGVYVLLQLLYVKPPAYVVPFSAAASDMAPTSFDMDPRGPEGAEGDLAPAIELPSISDSENVGSESAVESAENEGETGEIGRTEYGDPGESSEPQEKQP